jgi:hypothetical protein
MEFGCNDWYTFISLLKNIKKFEKKEVEDQPNSSQIFKITEVEERKHLWQWFWTNTKTETLLDLKLLLLNQLGKWHNHI